MIWPLSTALSSPVLSIPAAPTFCQFADLQSPACLRMLFLLGAVCLLERSANQNFTWVLPHSYGLKCHLFRKVFPGHPTLAKAATSSPLPVTLNLTTPIYHLYNTAVLINCHHFFFSLIFHYLFSSLYDRLLEGKDFFLFSCF